ncbi:MAG: GAF domain-containing protein [candidate division WOR-3 bacterium]|nr:GAF domain-containing protein [candidate division WOR-3 bacterium]
MATFLIHRSNEETQVVKLEKEFLTLGRLEDNDIVIDDIFVSRRHAEVIKKGNDYIIIDQKSRYGTYVNGERIVEKKLNYGDEIQVGNTLITFVDEKKLSAVPEHKTVVKKFGDIIDIEKRIDELKSAIFRGEKKERLIKTTEEIRQLVSDYRRRLAEAERAREIASTLCEVGKVINFVFDLNVLLNLLMDLALRIIPAKRGFIMLGDEDTRELKIKVARNMGGEIDPKKSSGISQTIAREAFNTRNIITTEDAIKDGRFKTQESVITYAIGSVVCVPLITKEKKVLGVIYLDNPVGFYKFTEDDIQFIESFASQSAVAIENAQLYEKVKKEERTTERLQRFFSPEVVKKIICEERAIKPGGEHCIATILFCDIRGYTSLTEKIDTVIALEILNEFLSSMTEEVFFYEGTLDKYIGDCVMAIFGAPVAHADDPLRAIKCALGMKRRVEELKKRWQERLKIQDVASFEIGIGINTGEVIAGNVGSEKRLEYTVVSSAVNIASRLEDIANPGQILITNSTYEQVKEHIKARTLPPVKLKNISQPVAIYEVLGLI